jgi:hypothetical protein
MVKQIKAGSRSGSPNNEEQYVKNDDRRVSAAFGGPQPRFKSTKIEDEEEVKLPNYEEGNTMQLYNSMRPPPQ